MNAGSLRGSDSGDYLLAKFKFLTLRDVQLSLLWCFKDQYNS